MVKTKVNQPLSEMFSTQTVRIQLEENTEATVYEAAL